MAETTSAINMAKAFVKDCNEAGLSFDKVVLFGSYAKGNATEWSDIDLLLVSKQFTKSAIGNLKLFLRVNAKYPSVEAHAYPTDYFLQGDAFIDDVMKDAIPIVG